MRTFHKSDDALKSRQKQIHGDFFPADVRQGERASAEGFCKDGGSFENIKIWRISPLGIEIAFPQKSELMPRSLELLHITLGRKMVEHRVIACPDSTVEEFNQKIIGYRFCDDGVRKGDISKTDDVLWSCHSSFCPTGSAVNQVRFNDWIYFRVLEINGSKMKISTSMRNKVMIPGMEFDCNFTFPSGKNCSAKLRILHSDVVTDSSGVTHELGVSIIEPNAKFLEQVANYIFTFGRHDKLLPTPKVLAHDGLYVKSVAEAIEYDYVRNEADFKQVCHLRSLAFRGVAGLGAVMSPEDMADSFDARARILVARFRGMIVGTLRVCFHRAADTFEEEQYCAFPAWFPERELMVEVSRAATHPEFRGSDLFVNLMRYCMLVTLQGGRHFIVAGTYDVLVPLYLRFGFRSTGVAASHPKFPGKKIYLLLGDARGVLTAKTKPMEWIALAPYVEKLIADDPSLKAGVWSRGRIALYRGAGPLINLLMSAQHKMQGRRIRKKYKDKKTEIKNVSSG